MHCVTKLSMTVKLTTLRNQMPATSSKWFKTYKMYNLDDCPKFPSPDT